MKFLLDFDEVIFNTEALKKCMEDEGIEGRTPQAIKHILEKKPKLFTTLVYPDAIAFLNKHGADCIIVSSAFSKKAGDNQDVDAELAFQEMKIQLALGDSLLGSLFRPPIVTEESKTTALQAAKEFTQAFGDDCIFVDDKDDYLREADELGITAIQMDRSKEGMILPGQSSTFESMRPMFERVVVSDFTYLERYIENVRNE